MPDPAAWRAKLAAAPKTLADTVEEVFTASPVGDDWVTAFFNTKP